jgi:hypothetical protein
MLGQKHAMVRPAAKTTIMNAASPDTAQAPRLANTPKIAEAMIRTCSLSWCTKCPEARRADDHAGGEGSGGKGATPGESAEVELNVAGAPEGEGTLGTAPGKHRHGKQPEPTIPYDLPGVTPDGDVRVDSAASVVPTVAPVFVIKKEEEEPRHEGDHPQAGQQQSPRHPPGKKVADNEDRREDPDGEEGVDDVEVPS